MAFTLLFAAASAQDAGRIAVAYLYVEPYQARVEVLFDTATVMHWLDPQSPPPAVLTAEAQKKLTATVAQRAGEWCGLKAAEQTLDGNFLSANIIKGKPGNTLPFEAGAEIALAESMVGLTWEFPTPPAPDNLTVVWKGFADFPAAADLPVTVFFGPKSEQIDYLTAASPQSMWESQGRIPTPPPLASVPEVAAGWQVAPGWRYAAVAFIILGLGYLVLLRMMRLRWPGHGVAGFAVWTIIAFALVALGALSHPAQRVKNPAQAETILRPLLRNVYRAFDHRAESEIYDVLDRSVGGDLLRSLYLETIQALTLDGREGTRVTIDDFSADVTGVSPAPENGPDAGGFVADCQWTALGRVGHWGHTHTRVNRYTARVTISPRSTGTGDDRDKAWKITGLEVSEARRL